MEDKFYSRATGKFKKATGKSYTSNTNLNRDQGTVYSLHDDEKDSYQVPLRCLTPSQVQYLQSFVSAIQQRSDIELDVNTRAIHWINSWHLKDHSLTISCSMIQPNISNCTCILNTISDSNARILAKTYFSHDESLHPHFVRTIKYCQLMGKSSLPFVDCLIKNNIIVPSNFQVTNIVLSGTQLIFCVCTKDIIYECKLSHISCNIIMQMNYNFIRISPPRTDGHNYSFRSPLSNNADGTGPYIAVHAVGSIQYQGKPEGISVLARDFRKCIDNIMQSTYAMKFLRSLSVIRHLPVA